MLSTIVQRWKLKKLIADWCRFRDLVLKALSGQGVESADEQQFLAIKASIASQLSVMLAPKAPSLQYESARQSTMMTDLLNRYRTLLIDPPSTPNEREEFEQAWHQHFIFLNKLKGAPAAAGRPAQARPGRVPSGIPIHRQYRRRATFGIFGALLRLGVVAIFLYLLGRAAGLGVEAGRIVASPPTSAAGVGRNVIAGLHSVWQGVTHIMDPVALAYGPTAAIALVGCLLLGVGYLVFVRS